MLPSELLMKREFTAFRSDYKPILDCCLLGNKPFFRIRLQSFSQTLHRVKVNKPISRVLLEGHRSRGLIGMYYSLLRLNVVPEAAFQLCQLFFTSSRAQTVTGKNLPPSLVAADHDFPIVSYILPNSSLPQMTTQSQHNRAGGGKPGIQCRPSW